MRIVLLGPQGAGKGTQAQRISHKTGAKHISTGDLVRAEIKSGSELGQTIKDYNDRSELVPDEINDPPPEDSEEDPGPFVQREGDTEEAIRRRLKIYHEQTEPRKDYYGQRGMLKGAHATQGIAEVNEDVLRAARPRNRAGLEGHDNLREEEQGG